MTGVPTFPFPIQLGTLPTAREGAKAVTVAVNWAQWNAAHNTSGSTANDNYTVPINLLPQYQSGEFTTVQAVWIDNSTVPYPFRLTCAQSGQTLNIPPFTQGMYPLLTQQAPQFVALLLVNYLPTNGVYLTNCTTTLEFLNTPQKPYEQAISPLGLVYGSLNYQISSSTATLQVLSAPAANQRYVLTGIDLTVYTAIAYNSSYIYPNIYEQIPAGGNSFPYWADYAATTSGAAGLLYRQQSRFPTGILLPNGGPVILAYGTNQAIGGVFNIYYGIVTIQ